MTTETDFAIFDDALKIFEDSFETKNEDENTCSEINDLNKLFNNVNIITSNNTTDLKIIKNNSCEHKHTTEENGSICCMDCGIQLEKKIFSQKEWRFYGQSDNKKTSDPNRVHLRKIDERTIYKDVENMGFSDKIVSVANEIYLKVTDGQIFRGNSRKAIIFACIFHSFKLNRKAQTHEKLIKIFDLSRKIGLKGLKYVNLNSPKDSIIHTTYITPANLVEEIMDKFSASQEQKLEVYKLYEQIKNKSSKINRSRPQSVSAGLVYYWICFKNIEISLKDFAKKTDLSELTINKIAKEIAKVLGTPQII